MFERSLETEWDFNSRWREGFPGCRENRCGTVEVKSDRKETGPGCGVPGVPQ